MSNTRNWIEVELAMTRGMGDNTREWVMKEFFISKSDCTLVVLTICAMCNFKGKYEGRVSLSFEPSMQHQIASYLLPQNRGGCLYYSTVSFVSVTQSLRLTIP